MPAAQPDDTAKAKPTHKTKRTSAKSSKSTKAKRSSKRKKQRPQTVPSTRAERGTATETPQSTTPIKRELPAVDLGALLTGILETPRPEIPISTTTFEEEIILSPEPLLPVTPFDVSLDTPYPESIEELEVTPETLNEATHAAETQASIDVGSESVAIMPEPEISSSPTATETAPPSQKIIEDPTQVLPEQRPAAERRPKFAVTRALLIVISLAVFLMSSPFLWQDASAAHLYVSSLNTANGKILNQEDMGRGYTSDELIASTTWQSSVFFGIANGLPASPVRQVVELQQRGTSWQETKQFSAPLVHGTLSVTRQGNLLIESANGLEVTTREGQLLWRMTGDQPAEGVHAFQPAFDSDTLYTVKAAAMGEIAAYDLRNGAPRWMAHLHDTFNYAPPMLLAGQTLYVAGDHTIFALNSSDGSVLWAASHAARTLLLSGNGARQLLIAASADGLLALNVSDGAPVWTFHGQVGQMTPAGVLSLTPTQFYQASATDTTIFATGIAWKAPETQPELWLYALDAATGTVRWSRQLASGTISADAGRVFTPVADSAQHLVILKQQQDSTTLMITAYDASTGQLRWQARFQGISASSSLLEPSHNALLFISLQADSGTALRVMTPVCLLLLTTMLLSILCLLLLLSTWRIQKERHRNALNQLVHEQQSPARNVTPARRFSRKLPFIGLFVVWIAACIVGYVQLNQAQESISLLDTSSGAVRWQHAIASPEALANEQEGILSTPEPGDPNMHRVQAMDVNGNIRWQTFASAGTFSVPSVPVQPGRLLLALSGHSSLHYAFAPDDPAYAHPLDSLFVLSLLNPNTGQPLWQSAIVNPGDQQSAAVIGADAHFIYIASLQTNPTSNSRATIQLLAIDQSSGLVSWRVYGPSESQNTPRDNGTLLVQGRRIFWQVEGAIYAIDSQMGQIAWRRSVGNDDPHTLLQEEGQLAGTNNLLLVARSNTIYALDPASGNVLWTLPRSGPSTLQTMNNLKLDGNTLLIYSNGQIDAIDLANQHLIWSRKLSAPTTRPVGAQSTMRTVDLSVNGKQIYVTIDANNAPGQLLLALDSKTGATLWHFQPSGQAVFTNVSVIPNQNILLATLCTPTTNAQVCSHEDLYAINATTGAVNWQVTATSISHIHISPDGDTVLIEKEGSAWQQL